MSRAPKPTHLPTRHGVSPSCVALPAGRWGTVLDFLCERLPAVTRPDWQARMDAGEVLWENAQCISADAPYRANSRVFYYRQLTNEPDLGLKAQIVAQDKHLVVVDKPHFMPVTPTGRFVQQSLLVQLKRLTGIDTLSPIHRIDRETAGLVLLSVQPHERNAYQSLFRERQVEKTYWAVAPWREHLQTPLTHRSWLEPDVDFFRSIERTLAQTQGRFNSETHLEMLQRDQDLALYQLKPVTGQRHQLRVHMQSLGAPIVGDQFYPSVIKKPHEADDLSQPLQLLARHIRFKDPLTHQMRDYTSRLTLCLP